VPTVLSMILQGNESMRKEVRQNLASLRLVRSAGAPLDVSVQRRFKGLLKPGVRVVNAWGLTECGTVTSLFYPEEDETGSGGRLLANFEAMSVGTNFENTRLLTR